MKMQASRLFKIGDFRTVEVDVPEPQGAQLLVKVEACGICGSDIPRIFELGTSKQKYPLTIGHEFGGEIVAVGEDADKALVGKRGAFFPCIPCRQCSSCETGDYAMCPDYDYLGSRSDGGFAEYCLVPSAWHFVESKNPDVSGDALSMVEPCTVAQHVIRKSGIQAGQSLMIFGAGPIGIMEARWAKIFGVEKVMLVDVVDEKVEFARERGCVCYNSRSVDVEAKFRELYGCPPDVTVEGTGTGSALGQCIDFVKTFGKVMMMGNPARDSTIKLAQHSKILRKEITIQGIWNSHYAQPFNEWNFTVLKLDSGEMTVEDLISHRSTLEDLPALCQGIYDHSITICKAMYSRNA